MTESTEHSGTVPELRDELRERDLPVSGTKDELIGRLEDADAADAADAADEAAEDATEEAAEGEADADEDETRSDTEVEADEQAAAAVADADLVTNEGEVKTDSITDYTADARAAIAEFMSRLDDLAAVLADLESRNADPASGALMAASVKVRAHMDDVQRHLGPLGGALQAVANEAAA